LDSYDYKKQVQSVQRKHTTGEKQIAKQFLARIALQKLQNFTVKSYWVTMLLIIALISSFKNQDINCSLEMLHEIWKRNPLLQLWQMKFEFIFFYFIKEIT